MLAANATKRQRKKGRTVVKIFGTCWSSLVPQMVKNLPAVQETQVPSWVGKISWRREWLLTPVSLPGEFQGQRKPVGYGS